LPINRDSVLLCGWTVGGGGRRRSQEGQRKYHLDDARFAEWSRRSCMNSSLFCWRFC